ncbi:XRE family transcriptional regulator [Bombilactobacillus bombi]|uniref:XRE family transcriptional regulator n=1 Tax=Bombilactobacillus bombi TaxID=1303590 RepID=A0A3R6W7K1_9LACO|nr:helix-turn-helix transcriptional regulator [Bombilactobacillus bombi]RHW46121.1 XRE family transcriptional regulator [Bombilactobacillus bombi]RHW48265.1 XRE family transcriptional regulator [Bombilactobacillus bombi]
MSDQQLLEAAEQIETKFKIALLTHHITQREMASMLGTGPQQVNRAIKGDMSPMSRSIRDRMKRLLNID